MLEIFANNKRLDLRKDISINMTFESPFLLQDRIPAPYSLSFSLPATPTNLAVFGNPHRMASKGVWTELPSRLRFNMVTFPEGKIVLQECDKKLKVNFVGSKLPGAVKENMSEMDLERFDFGAGTYDDSHLFDQYAINYINTILDNVKNGDKFTACPIRVKKEDWIGRRGKDYVNDAYQHMYLNNMNVASGDYVREAVGGVEYHSLIFPQMYIHYLLDSVFGDLLVDNPFKDIAALKDLVVVSTYHKNYASLYNTSGILLDNGGGYYTKGENNYFKLNSFLNDYPFNDFFKDLLKIFCCSFIPRPDGKWSIIPNEYILREERTENWDTKLVGTPTITQRKGESYGYGYNSEKKKEEPEKRYLTLNHISALLTADPGIYNIKSTGEIYEKKLRDKDVDTDPDTYIYECKYNGLGGSDVDGDYNMKSDVAPLPMQIGDYIPEGFQPELKPWYTPEFPDDRKDKTLTPSIGFFRGWLNVETGQILNSGDYSNSYPYMCPFEKDLKGNDISYYSLAWDGEYGLYRYFHKHFRAYINQDKKVLTSYFRLTELDLKNIDWTKKISINGSLFFLNKVEVTIKARKISLCKCELIET